MADARAGWPMSARCYALVEHVEVGDVTRSVARYYARTPALCERERRASWYAGHRDMAIVEVSAADYAAVAEYPTAIDPDVDYRGALHAAG